MNTELLLLGVGILVLLASWRWMVKPTLLDATRDKLFDLREEVREFFMTRPRGLEDRLYVNTRNLINGHLRNTEEITIIRFVSALLWLDANKDAAHEISEKVNRKFKSEDEEAVAYVGGVRSRAMLIMVEYAGTTSLLSLLVVAVGYLLQPLLWMSKMIKALLTGTGRVAKTAFAAQAAAVVISVTSSVGLGGRDAAQAAMEDCALYQA